VAPGEVAGVTDRVAFEAGDDAEVPHEAVDLQLIGGEVPRTREEVPAAGDALRALRDFRVRGPDTVNRLVDGRKEMEEPDPRRVGHAPVEGGPGLGPQLASGVGRAPGADVVAVKPPVPVPVVARLRVERPGEIARASGEFALRAKVMRRGRHGVSRRPGRSGGDAQGSG